MQYKIEVNRQIQIFDLNKFAKQANSAVLLREGKNVFLATLTRDAKPVDEDFLPLTVHYQERAYAAGRIPGGYIKRETKPSDLEVLTARIIDRSLRPMFPSGYAYPTQIVVMALSLNEGTDVAPLALNAASVALFLSDVGIKAPVCGVRVACVDGEFLINPTNSELEKSSLDLMLSGSGEELLMIEMRALASEASSPGPVLDIAAAPVFAPTWDLNEISEEDFLKALDTGLEAIATGTKAYENAFKAHRKEADLELKSKSQNADIALLIKELYAADVKEALSQMAKSERAGELDAIASKIAASSVAKEQGWQEDEIKLELNAYKRSILRSAILNERKRPDGRDLEEVREISIETNILPLAHGSCLFTRGQTQALVVCTLGSDQDAQNMEILTQKGSYSERFMFNYNFPGFCVGESTPLRAPGRRELGHANLAKRALAPSIDPNYPHTIRVVSEILESNGSSSMASVCGGSLALRAAGVNSSKLIAGVAMGLVIEEDKHAVLSDIAGLEDHDGDMDFKVAGSRSGITALQMDIKLGGLDRAILKEALMQAKRAREHILNLMEEANKDIVVNDDVLPGLELFSVDPSRIVDIIGQAGKTIKEIIERFGVSIDLDRERGEVKISGQGGVRDAKNYIIELVQKEPTKRPARPARAPMPALEVGQEIRGAKVKKCAAFGTFIELKDGFDGLLHSKKSKGRDFNEGDLVDVLVAEIKDGKVNLELL